MEEIQSAIDIQCSDGNWNYSEYMMGMANGMIFVKSCLTGEDPEYLDGPEVWGKDKPSVGMFLQPKGRQMKWISVEDRLPEEGVEVLLTDGLRMDVDHYYHGKNDCWANCPYITPTHWMPLPGPPETE